MSVHSHVFRTGAAVFCIGFLISILVSWRLDKNNELKQQNAVTTVMSQTLDSIQRSFYLYQYGLRGLRGAILAEGADPSHDQIATYFASRDQSKEFPGAKGFGFIRRVPQGSEGIFLKRSYDAGWPISRIFQMLPYSGEHYVIQFTSSLSLNEVSTGFDIASEPNRRGAAQESMATGDMRLTAPVALGRSPTGLTRQSFLMMLPVYLGGSTPPTVALREQKAIGWTYVALQMDEVLAELPLDSRLFHLQLLDVTDRASPVKFFTKQKKGGAYPYFSKVAEQPMFGRVWQIKISASDEFVRNMGLISPYLVLCAGTLFSLIASMLCMTLLENRRRQSLLDEEQARRAAIISSSGDGIIGKTCQGVVTDWNKGAEELFGYTSDEVVGKQVIDLIVPSELREEEEMILQCIRNGMSVPHFETRRLTKQGTLLDVSVTVSPIRDSNGRVVGASKTIRDISQQKEDQRRIHELNASLELLVKQRTEELSKVNQLLGSVLNAATDISIIATNEQGEVTLFNSGAESLLGYAESEMMGRMIWQNVYDYLHIKPVLDEQEMLEQFRLLVQPSEEKGVQVREWMYRCKTGERVPVSLMITTIRDDVGCITGYLFLGIDISRHKAAERELAAIRETNQMILDTTINPVFTLDEHGKVTSFNKASEQVFQYTADEVVGLPFEQLFQHIDGSAMLAECWQQSAAGSYGQEWEVQAIRKDRSTFPAQLSLGGGVTGEGNVAVGVISDLTLLHEQHAALLYARDQLQMASEVAGLGVWRWTLQDNLLEWNDRMLEIYGYPLSLRDKGLAYEHWSQRLHPDDRDGAETCLKDAVAGIRPFDAVFRVVHDNGDIRYVQAAAQIERDDEGNALRVTGVNFDISSQHKLESTLRYAKAQADAASASKSTFLANMSHEIRTPMNAVLGMLQLLSHTPLNGRQTDYINKAQGAASALLGLLNDILDYSKIEAGKLQLDQHPFALEDLLRNLAIVMSGNQSKREVEVIFDIDPLIPQLLVGDSLRLQQVLINLAGNALKFTMQGFVKVQVRVLDLEQGQQDITLRFAVQDSGIGISKEQQSRIFDAFTQAEASTSRRFGGTGLGLVISRHLVSLMGADLHMESEPGVGSRFWFDIRLPISDATLLSQLSDRYHEKLQVLVVEDNLLTADIIVQTVEALGWEAKHAAEGYAAVRAVRQAQQDNQPYDVILMDWKMPDLDGLSTARLIKQTMEGGGHPPPMIIMLTAYDREMLAEVVQNEEVPFADFLNKPVTPLQLVTSVGKVLGRGAEQDQAQVLPTPPVLTGLRLLVVEDNALNRQIASELLANAGASVDVAEGGLQGVEAVKSAAIPFDLVLMDVQMPDIDGLEATRRLRADSRFAQLPILAMTANVSASDQADCLEAGMNGHVGKPINLAVLINAILKQVGHRVIPEQAMPDNTASMIEPVDSIITRFGGNLSLYKRVLADFLPNQQALLSDIQKVVVSGDKDKARQTMHTIKGNASNMGATRLAEQAAYLEGVLKSPEGNVSQLSPVVLSDLSALLLDSTRLLNDSVVTMVSGKNGTYSKVNRDEWLANVAKLEHLLSSGNLAAVKLLESMPDTIPWVPDAVWHTLQQTVNELDFTAALNALEVVKSYSRDE